MGLDGGNVNLRPGAQFAARTSPLSGGRECETEVRSSWLLFDMHAARVRAAHLQAYCRLLCSTLASVCCAVAARLDT